MEDDGGERSSFVIGLIENRAKEVTPFGSWEMHDKTEKKYIWDSTSSNFPFIFLFEYSIRQLLKFFHWSHLILLSYHGVM